MLGGEDELGVELPAVHRAAHVLTDDQLCVVDVARPPEHQLGVVGHLIPHIPVDLRDDVVDEPLLVPEEEVGVEVVVILQSCRS